MKTRYLLGCHAHGAISLKDTKAHFTRFFEEYGLPQRIRTDNGVPFASNALARLSTLSVWWIKLGIYPEQIEPGKPQQNGKHERMHRTLKKEAIIPPEKNLKDQQERFDVFRKEYNITSLSAKRPRLHFMFLLKEGCPRDSITTIILTISKYDGYQGIPVYGGRHAGYR